MPHIYAAGDCSGPAEIVHIAIQQGELAARHAAGVRRLKPVDYSLLLNVVFTDPQLATIGLLERELDEEGDAYLVAQLSVQRPRQIDSDGGELRLREGASPSRSAAASSAPRSSARMPAN